MSVLFGLTTSDYPFGIFVCAVGKIVMKFSENYINNVSNYSNMILYPHLAIHVSFLQNLHNQVKVKTKQDK